MYTNIDKVIAERVMGWNHNGEYHTYYVAGSNLEFSPSTDMNHTLLVMEKLKELGFSTLLRDCSNEDCGIVKSKEATRDDYYCSISTGSIYSEKFRFKSIAKTPQMAVCLSALKAVGVIDND
ncbi:MULTISPECIES: BC1872 family protein [Bacillus]|uniref:BC1872 family protein n=1 Tax=Bacillus TaxID=1386 RepID=UPI0003305644|nr:hypothetical protein [Bacillus cereus]EOO44242.1 hypothetical protein ICK_06499 [Bacillus cereus BAG1X2-2]EOP00359.1 hypothetical protein ICO_06315 [Bacillus cereus BAG2O-1]